MKRDMDLVRDLLLIAEARNHPDLQTVLANLGRGVRSFDDPVCCHLNMLVEEEGLLSAINAKTYDGPNWLRLELTWQGHDFLHAVRDNQVWKAAKTGAEVAGGRVFNRSAQGSSQKGCSKRKLNNTRASSWTSRQPHLQIPYGICASLQ